MKSRTQWIISRKAFKALSDTNKWKKRSTSWTMWLTTSTVRLTCCQAFSKPRYGYEPSELADGSCHIIDLTKKPYGYNKGGSTMTTNRLTLQEFKNYLRSNTPKQIYFTDHGQGVRYVSAFVRLSMEGAELKVGVNSRIVIIRDRSGSEAEISNVQDVLIQKSDGMTLVKLRCAYGRQNEAVCLTLFP